MIPLCMVQDWIWFPPEINLELKKIKNKLSVETELKMKLFLF